MSLTILGKSEEGDLGPPLELPTKIWEVFLRLRLDLRIFDVDLTLTPLGCIRVDMCAQHDRHMPRHATSATEVRITRNGDVASSVGTSVADISDRCQRPMSATDVRENNRLSGRRLLPCQGNQGMSVLQLTV